MKEPDEKKIAALVKKLLVELGEDDYTLEELRLMRIKFLSDVGN